LALLVTSPFVAAASDCSKYFQLLNNYYRLDQQEFRSISCNIDSPTLNNSLSQFRTMLSPLRDKIDIKDNLTTFSLTYTKSGGLKINNPSFDVRIISEEGMTDPAKARRGIEMVNNGFKQIIEGIVMQLEGIFEGFRPLKQTDCKIEEMTHNNSVYTVKYEKDNSVFTEIFSKNQRKIKQASKTDGETFAVENYDKLFNDKQVLTSAHVTMDQPIMTMEMDVSISYEDIKGVLFPTHIVTHSKQSMQTFLQEGQIDIYLRNCTLE
jgi:hypothetical protein